MADTLCAVAVLVVTAILAVIGALALAHQSVVAIPCAIALAAIWRLTTTPAPEETP